MNACLPTAGVVGRGDVVTAQQITKGFGSHVNLKSVAVSAGIGAATAGVGVFYAQAAKAGTITATQAVARTAAANGALGAAGSAVDSLAHGEVPAPEKMAVAGTLTMGLSAASGRVANSRTIALDTMAAAKPNTPAGIGGHIAPKYANCR